MSNYKETAVFNVSKDCIVNLKEDTGFKEYIVKHLSSELAERIMDILEREKEIIVRQSDLNVSEFIPTNSMEYRQQISWNPLVRCNDCKWWNSDEETCIENGGLWRASDFCSLSERKENEVD